MGGASAPIKTPAMALEPTLEEQDLLAATVQRRFRRMTPRERVGELVTGVGFVLVVAVLLVLHPPTGFELEPAPRALRRWPARCSSASRRRLDSRFPPSWRSSRCCSPSR